MKSLLEIFWTFVKIGAVTFGGGYAILPILERELIHKKQWVTMDEVVECYAIAQVTPGVIALNASTFIGCKRNGIMGGVLATLGFMVPGVTLMILISLFLQQFKDLPVVQNAFGGIRLVVGALILNTVIKLIKSFFAKGNTSAQNIISLAICVICFVLSLVFKTNPAILVCAAGLVGFFIFRNNNAVKAVHETQTAANENNENKTKEDKNT